ncbi:MAG: hypothetical protein KBG15_12685 [Kofleriaceae bacterium]|nr:hypothetical protein [Kofleriaceae bacterium]
MKSVVAAVIVMLALASACAKPPVTAAAVAPSRAAPDMANASALPVVVNVASARPTISASHASDIEGLAVTRSGSAALTLDGNGGVRLWPSLRGDVEPVIVQFNEPTKIALGERADFLVAAAIDGSGGLQIQVLSKSGGQVLHEAIRGDAEFIDVVFVAGQGLLALSADQQLHRIADNGRVTQTFTMPPGMRAVTLCHANGVVVALARNAGNPVALTLGGTSAAPVWSAPFVLPATSMLETVNLDAHGQRLAVAVGARPPAQLPPPAAVPPANAPPVIVGPTRDHVAVYALASRTVLGRINLPSNAFTVNAVFRPVVAFITKDRLYYRGAVSGQLDLGGVTQPTLPDTSAAAADPWIAAPSLPMETEDNRGPSAAVTLGAEGLLVAHGRHLRIETNGATKYLGYRYAQLWPFDTQGNVLLAWNDSRRTLLTFDPAKGQVRGAKHSDLSDMVAYDDRHRIGLVRAAQGRASTLHIVAIFDDEPTITVPNVSADAYSVQFGQRSSLLALHNNKGEMALAVYDRVHNTAGKPFVVKGRAYIYMVDPALTSGVVAYSATYSPKIAGLVEMAVTAYQIEAGEVKVARTFRIPGSVFAVAPSGEIYVARNVEHPNQTRGFDVYHEGVKDRELLLPGMPELSPDGRRLVVFTGTRLSVYDAAGQRLWVQSAARGALVWAADGQQLFVAAEGGVMTFDAATGAATSRCGWHFGLSNDIPEDAGRSLTRSICEHAL